MTRATTDRQEEVLEAIRAYHLTHGYGPAIRDLLAPLGVSSTNAVNDHLRALAAKGLVARAKGVPRSLRVVEPAAMVLPPTRTWAWPRGTRRGAWRVLLAAVLRAAAPARPDVLRAIAVYAERPSILEPALPPSVARRWLAACGPEPVELDGDDVEAARRDLRACVALIEDDSGMWRVGPGLDSIGHPVWAEGRARFAAHCLATIPKLPTVSHAA